MPWVLWRCWLGGRKGIRPVKNWVVGCRHGYVSGARCRLAYGPADATATHCLASVKSRFVLAFWYQLTWVVPEKGPLNVWHHILTSHKKRNRESCVISQYAWVVLLIKFSAKHNNSSNSIAVLIHWCWSCTISQFVFSDVSGAYCAKCILLV